MLAFHPTSHSMVTKKRPVPTNARQKQTAKSRHKSPERQASGRSSSASIPADRRRFLFAPYGRTRFGKGYCFLCQRKLTPKNTTREHVIPLWLQQRYNLADQRLRLLNGTTIPYRLLTIPCCYRCNNRFLSPIETAVQRAFDQGYLAVSKLPELTLFLWAGKIVYGLLYRQHLLDADRQNKEQGPIIPADLLEQFRLHHQFLQAARHHFRFTPCLPASIFVYQVAETSNPSVDFDYWDELERLAFSVRIGGVGLIVCLQDGAAVRQCLGDKLRYEEQAPLNPVQFAEITAHIFYLLHCFNRVPKFMLMEGKNEVHVLTAPLGGLSGTPLFDDWNPDIYAGVLSHCLRIPREILNPEPGRVMTWLFNADGSVKKMGPDDPP